MSGVKNTGLWKKNKVPNKEWIYHAIDKKKKETSENYLWQEPEWNLENILA